MTHFIIWPVDGQLIDFVLDYVWLVAFCLCSQSPSLWTFVLWFIIAPRYQLCYALLILSACISIQILHIVNQTVEKHCSWMGWVIKYDISFSTYNRGVCSCWLLCMGGWFRFWFRQRWTLAGRWSWTLLNHLIVQEKVRTEYVSQIRHVLTITTSIIVFTVVNSTFAVPTAIASSAVASSAVASSVVETSTIITASTVATVSVVTTTIFT